MVSIPVEERLAIEELTRLYALYCDTRDYGRLTGLFTEACTYDETVVGGHRVDSRAAIAQLFADASKRLGPMIHICTNHIVSGFSGLAASGLCYVLAEGIFNLPEGEQPFRIFGYYDDRYAKEDGRWYFKSRVLQLLVPSQGASTLGGITYAGAAEHYAVR